MFKFKKKDLLLIILLVFLIIVALVVIHVSMMNTFPKYKEIATIPGNVILTIFASSLGGAFTLLGVEKTFKEQGKIEFVKQFPTKVYYLDELIKELQEFKDKVILSNSQFLIQNQNKIASLFNLATDIDGYIYFEARKAHIEFSKIIDEMFNDVNERIFVQNEYGEHKMIKGKESENELRIETIQSIVQQLIVKCDSYRNSFIEHYNKNIDQDIYHSI